MIKYLSFLRMTDRGQATPPEKIAEVYSKMLAITEAYGGKTLEIWCTAGDYDFVTLADFPSDEAAFKVRTKLNQLDLVRVDGGPTFPIETYLAAAAEMKEPVAV